MNRFSTALDGIRALAQRASERRNRDNRRAANRRLHLCDLRMEQLEDRALLSVGGTGIPATAPATLTTDSLLPALESNPVQHTYAYAPVTVQASTANDASRPLSAYPASYDLRSGNYVTSVKDQGSYGTCWAFATYGSLESSILKAGGSTTDFSERNLAYQHGFDPGPSAGGNSWMSEAYLSRFSGPINETDDPYSLMGTPDSVTGPVQDYVREMLRFDTDSEMKNAIMTYGALDTSMYWDAASYNAANNTYFYFHCLTCVDQT